jgi:hypothetical protein
MGRLIFVAGCWFAFWMAIGALVGGLTDAPGGGAANGIYFGAFHGAWFAVLASFAWPWLMPNAIDRWMDRGG